MLFSPMEQQVMKIIGKKAKSINTIALEYYEGKTKPSNPRNVVANVIKKINAKCERHRLPFFYNGSGIGRGGRRIWKDFI